MIKPLRDVIKEIRQNYPHLDFMHGDCFKFYLILKEYYPEAVPYYNGEHVTVMLYGRLWDANGVVYYPMESEPRIMTEAFNWSSGNGTSVA